MGTAAVPLLAAALTFAAIILVGMLIVRRQDQKAMDRTLDLVKGYASRDAHAAIVEATKNESALVVPLRSLGTVLVGSGARERLQNHAVYAGESAPDIVDKTVVRKVSFLLLGLVLGLLLGWAGGGLLWLTVPASALGGFFVPDLLMYNAGLKRDEQIALGLPDALDMLNLCTESGLSFQGGLAQVAENQKGPVAAEFALVLQEMQFGRSRGQALAAMGARTRQEDIQRFVSAMLQVDKLGVPVSTVLREQAREMRAKRFARAREQAQKVPVKILMPLMLCFLPALFIIILGPAVASIAKVFSGM